MALASFSLLSTISCTICGLKNDYGKLTQKKLVHDFSSTAHLVNNEVYKINVVQLKSKLKKSDSSLVVTFYQWAVPPPAVFL
ncbi:hypothetical protein SAMN05421544_11046 [Riemerella columbipharyngis]|uniref:Uncharacterized protein n=1 Tax=Riemerella columbipharyngis TaxID=1071918 RepID=A0A1G7D8A6_9FLAO|nr:hypothetical protein SAMN05421544_11046 [Riemerella columbipharyngis]